MTSNPISGLIPRGSLGLKLLLVCVLVLAMGIPLLVVGGLVGEREARAAEVTSEIGYRAGGPQIVGGPMLLVPYQRVVETTDSQGRVHRQTLHGSYVVFAETGSAEAQLDVEERRRGIYRAAVYSAETEFDASFRPAAALEDVDASYRFDWDEARVLMFVSDSRAVRNAAQVRFADGTAATFEPVSNLQVSAPTPEPVADAYGRRRAPQAPLSGALAAFAAPARLTGPADFTVESRLELTGAQRFSIAAFAQDTSATIRGDRRDVSVQGFFQSTETLVGGRNARENADGGADEPSAAVGANEFAVTWRVPFVARGLDKAADLASFDIGAAAGRDMAVAFVSSDNIYQGVARAVRYGIMFIGIVFLATLIFEAVSGRKAHPAQYLLVGLAQCVFYLLLLSMTELMGFTTAFLVAAAATVALLAYYAGASFRSRQVGLRALAGLGLLYGAMYVLMTLEDYAMLAGSLVAFIVIAATMFATRGIDWYGRGGAAPASSAE